MKAWKSWAATPTSLPVTPPSAFIEPVRRCGNACAPHVGHAPSTAVSIVAAKRHRAGVSALMLIKGEPIRLPLYQVPDLVAAAAGATRATIAAIATTASAGARSGNLAIAFCAAGALTGICASAA